MRTWKTKNNTARYHTTYHPHLSSISISRPPYHDGDISVFLIKIRTVYTLYSIRLVGSEVRSKKTIYLRFFKKKTRASRFLRRNVRTQAWKMGKFNGPPVDVASSSNRHLEGSRNSNSCHQNSSCNKLRNEPTLEHRCR